MKVVDCEKFSFCSVEKTGQLSKVYRLVYSLLLSAPFSFLLLNFTLSLCICDDMMIRDDDI